MAILVALAFAIGACSGGLDGDTGLSDEARTASESPSTEVYISAASAWEIEGLTIVTRDAAFGAYGVPLLVA